MEQTPVAGSQVPARWQASEGVQITVGPATHDPFWQESLRVQALPSALQDVLFETGS